MAESVHIREERSGDLDAIRDVNRQAFGQEQEGQLIDALRANGAATLSMVAVHGDDVVGHILFSPLTVGQEKGGALGPMAVLPGYQRQGIGSRLVQSGLERLRLAGCPFVVVVGHPEFYPRFGFRPAHVYGLRCQWDVPPEVFMVALLNEDVGTRLAGLAEYRAEFALVE